MKTPKGNMDYNNMKHRPLIISITILCFWTLCGFFCTSENDLYQPCGLYLNVDLPQNADSIHVSIYNNKSFYYSFRDEVICPKCEPSNRPTPAARFIKDPDDLDNISNWKYGTFFMAETVFCGNKKTIFPIVSFSVEKGRNSTYIYVEHRESSTSQQWTKSSNYDFTAFKNDSTFNKTLFFTPIENGCDIDSTYTINASYADLCHKRSDNYLF